MCKFMLTFALAVASLVGAGQAMLARGAENPVLTAQGEDQPDHVVGVDSHWTCYRAYNYGQAGVNAGIYRKFAVHLLNGEYVVYAWDA